MILMCAVALAKACHLPRLDQAEFGRAIPTIRLIFPNAATRWCCVYGAEVQKVVCLKSAVARVIHNICREESSLLSDLKNGPSWIV